MAPIQSKNLLKEFAKLIKNLVEPTPNSLDDTEAQGNLASFEAGSVQVKPLKFSASSRAALSILALREQVNAMAPSRSRQADGIIGDDNHKNRASDHNPWVMDGEIGVVTAIDITHDPDRGCDASALANSILGSRDSRIKYVIHNKKIANARAMDGVEPWAWRPYGGAHPHTGHVHISVQSVKKLYDDTSAWDLTGMVGGAKLTPSASAKAKAVLAPIGNLELLSNDSKIAWGRRVTPDFKREVMAVSDRLRIDPNNLMAVMAFETARTFSPSIPNGAGSGAVGLIQFMPKTAMGLGTTTMKLAKMSPVEQLSYVEKHFRPWTGKMTDLASVYMAVLWPKAVNKPLSYVLFEAPSSAYKMNKPLDADDDMKITKAEAAAKVQAALVEGMRPENYG